MQESIKHEDIGTFKGVSILFRAPFQSSGHFEPQHGALFFVCFVASQFSNYPPLSLHLRDKDKMDSGKDF